MPYLVAKKLGKEGSVALEVDMGKALMEFKRKIQDLICDEQVELVTISRFAAYPEYEPYTRINGGLEDENNTRIFQSGRS